jgi:hypothetical protein
MSLVGKPVYHVHSVDQIQFGNVVDEKTERDWLWVQVNWSNGEPHNMYNSPTIDIDERWFRIDTVTVFEPEEMINTIQSL